jgi:hypothetical protein
VAEALMRRVLAFALAAIAIGAGYWALANVAPPRPEITPIQWLYAVSQDDIEKVSVALPARRFSFVKRSETWFFEVPAGAPVDQARWSAIPLLLSGTTVARRLEGVDDPAAYGLEPPRMIIDVYLRGERRIQIQVGDATPDGANTYVALAGLPGVSLVNAAWAKTLSALVLDPPLARR